MSTKHYISYERYKCSHGIGEYKSDNIRSLPQEILDKIADEVRDQGWTKQLKRRNKCNVCFTYKSKSNTCLCD